MIRKFQLHLAPTAATESVLLLSKATRKRWPEEWSELGICGGELGRALEEEATALRELLAEISTSFWIDVEEKFDHSFQQAMKLKFPSHKVSFDLKDVLKDERSLDALFAVAALLAKLRKTSAYVVNLKLGGRRFDLSEGLRALLEMADEHGISFFAEEPTETHEPQDSSHKKLTGATVLTDRSPEHERGEAHAAESTQENDDTSQSTVAEEEETESWGSFGGLGEEEWEEEEPQAHFSPTEEEISMEWSLLPEAAQRYLSFLELEWPCPLQSLEKSFKQAVRLAHPDRHLHDPGAHQRFVMLQKGFAFLRDHAT